MMTSSKLEARLAEIDTYDWSEEQKGKAKELAILNAETVASITNNGKYQPKAFHIGADYLPTPRPNTNDDPNEAIRWQDAFDPS